MWRRGLVVAGELRVQRGPRAPGRVIKRKRSEDEGDSVLHVPTLHPWSTDLTLFTPEMFLHTI